MSETLTTPTPIEATRGIEFVVPQDGMMPIGHNRPIISDQERDQRGLATGAVIADIEVAEQTFAPATRFSVIEAMIPLRDDESGKKTLRTFLIGMQGDSGKERYIAGTEVDITNQSIGYLKEEQAKKLGLSPLAAQSFVVGKIFNGNVIAVRRTGEQSHLKVTADTDKRFVDHIEPPKPLQPEDESWSYTLKAQDLAKKVNFGREQIGRDTRIEGGVFVTASARHGAIGEAIVVDDKYDKDWLDTFQKEVLRLAQMRQGDRTLAILTSAFHYVKQKMPYDTDGSAIQSVLNEVAESQGKEKFEDGTKVPLSEFVGEKGQCRHQALMLGRGLESLVDTHKLSAKVSVDRNKLWDPNQEKYGGHAWVRVEVAKDEVYILDVAQGYFGRLKDSKSLAEWNYYRPEEMAIEQARDAVRDARGN